MEKKGLWVVILFLGLSLVMVDFFGCKEATGQQVIKWKGQSAYPTAADVGPFKGGVAGNGNSAVNFVKWIERETGGRLKIDLAQPGAIVPVGEMFNAVSKGALDFAGLYYGGFHTGQMPETDVETGLPFAWERPEEGWDAYYNRGLNDEFNKIYAEHNIYFIPQFVNSNYSFGTIFPCPNPDALKGKKIRALGIYGELVKRLGGSPTVIPAAEMYMAFKLGTIDGAVYSLENIELNKLKEVLKEWVFEPNFNVVVGSFLINLDSYKKLPEDIRRFIDYNTKFFQLQRTMNGHVYDLYVSNQSAKQYPFKLVRWSAGDVAKVRKMGIELWDKVASKSPRCAKLVDIVRLQMRELGKLD